MALTVQMYKVHNHLTNEDIVIPRLVHQQTMDFNQLCEYLADGSTVTAADVSAVMKQIESRLPLVLGLNAKVICSPEGLTFRPKVSGSITQKQLKEKLQSDLTTGDLTASIDISLPKKWTERFHTKAEFKRIMKTPEEEEQNSDNDTQGGGSNSGGPSTEG